VLQLRHLDVKADAENIFVHAKLMDVATLQHFVTFNEGPPEMSVIITIIISDFRDRSFKLDVIRDAPTTVKK